MATKPSYLVIDDLRGGRNGLDPPWAISDNQCADAVNVEWNRTRLGRRRAGGVSTGTFATNQYIAVLMRHTPGENDSTSELWAIQGTTPIFSRNYVAVTAADTPAPLSTTTDDACGLTINGKLGLAYPTTTLTDRLHIWDGTVIRRTGIAAPAGVSAADGGGAGAYTGVRYYRQRWTVQATGITIRRSEAGASGVAAPDGAHANVTVTQASLAAGETATHWELEASVDNITFYRIATIAIATTTYADTAAITTYNQHPLSALAGTYQLQPSYRFLAGDQNRLIGFGTHHGVKKSRLEFSAVIGSLDIGDEERVDATTNYFLDCDERDTGDPTGLGGPINGSFLAFKWRSTYLLSPTGQITLPFKSTTLSHSVGCMHHKSICVGEDTLGNPALYWMSNVGAYRYGANGMEYIGHGVEDLTRGVLNQSNFNGVVQAHSVFFRNNNEVWFWFMPSTGALSQRILVIFNVKTGGWARYTGNRLQASCCSVMFSPSTLTGVSGQPMVPFTGSDESAVQSNLSKWGQGAVDPNAPFQAYVVTKAYEIAGPGRYGACGQSLVTATAQPGVTIFDTLIPDYGNQSAKIGSASIAPVGTEERVRRILEDSDFAGDFTTIQHQIGDVSFVGTSWSLEKLVTPLLPQEAVVE